MSRRANKTQQRSQAKYLRKQYKITQQKAEQHKRGPYSSSHLAFQLAIQYAINNRDWKSVMMLTALGCVVGNSIAPVAAQPQVTNNDAPPRDNQVNRWEIGSNLRNDTATLPISVDPFNSIFHGANIEEVSQIVTGDPAKPKKITKNQSKKQQRRKKQNPVVLEITDFECKDNRFGSRYKYEGSDGDDRIIFKSISSKSQPSIICDYTATELATYAGDDTITISDDSSNRHYFGYNDLSRRQQFHIYSGSGSNVINKISPEHSGGGPTLVIHSQPNNAIDTINGFQLIPANKDYFKFNEKFQRSFENNDVIDFTDHSIGDLKEVAVTTNQENWTVLSINGHQITVNGIQPESFCEMAALYGDKSYGHKIKQEVFRSGDHWHDYEYPNCYGVIRSVPLTANRCLSTKLSPKFLNRSSYFV